MTVSPLSPSRQPKIDMLVSDLCKRLRVSDAQIRALVEERSHHFLGARVTSFVPLLIERHVRDHLRRQPDPGPSGPQPVPVIDLAEHKDRRGVTL